MKNEEFQEDDDLLMDFLSETLPCKDVNEINNAIKKGSNYSSFIKEIEEKSKTDKEIKNQIRLRRDIKKAILEIDDVEYIKKQVDLFDKPGIHLLTTKKWWLLAASVVLIAVFSFVFFSLNKNEATDTDSLFAAYYSPLKAKQFFDLGESTSFKQAKKNYTEGNYQKAISILESLPSTINIEDEKNLYTGLSYMELANFNKAVEIFESMSRKFTEPPVVSHIHWYLSLCYIKTGNIANARKSLDVIVQNNLQYKSQAKKILKKIR